MKQNITIKQLLEVKNMRDEIINSIEGLEENYGDISQRQKKKSGDRKQEGQYEKVRGPV